jgi:hypothetical protein
MDRVAALVAAVVWMAGSFPEDCELDRSTPRNSDCTSARGGEVDYSTSDEWATVRDANDDLLAVSLVDDGDPRSERQRSVRGCQRAGI